MGSGVSLPRQVLPQTTYLLTRRCAQRQLLLTPSSTTNQVVLYCLHRAAEMYGVELHAVQALSNHLHIIATDVRGELPSFMAWVDREIAKCMNDRLDRAEAFWSNDHYSGVVLHDAQAVVDKLVYVFVNCVAARLVRNYGDWPGVYSTPRDWGAPPRSVERPEFYFSQRDERWAEASVRYTVPPALRDRDPLVLRASIDDAVAERERELRAEVRRTGKTFLGAERVLEQSSFDFPKSAHRKGKLSPTFAAGSAEGQRRARKMLRHFRAAYREALGIWRRGIACIFPAGTYWLARFVNVCCAPLETAMPALDSG